MLNGEGPNALRFYHIYFSFRVIRSTNFSSLLSSYAHAIIIFPLLAEYTRTYTCLRAEIVERVSSFFLSFVPSSFALSALTHRRWHRSDASRRHFDDASSEIDEEQERPAAHYQRDAQQYLQQQQDLAFGVVHRHGGCGGDGVPPSQY